MAKYNFSSLAEFEAMEATKASRARNGKSSELRDFFTDNSNIGKVLNVPNSWLECAKSPNGYDANTTEEQLGKVMHAFNAMVNRVRKDDFGGKLDVAIKIDSQNRIVKMLYKGNGKETANRIEATPTV